VIIRISAKESVGYYRLKKHKPWFDVGCLKLLNQRKQTKLQRLVDQNEINGDKLDNENMKTADISGIQEVISERQNWCASNEQ
jgi:hypothetical protein